MKPKPLTSLKEMMWPVFGHVCGGVVDSATHAVSTAASDVGDVVTSVSKDVAHTIKAGVNDAEQAASDVVGDELAVFMPNNAFPASA